MEEPLYEDRCSHNIERDAELVLTKPLADQVHSNPGGAIVEEILQLQRGAPAWRFMTVRRPGEQKGKRAKVAWKYSALLDRSWFWFERLV
ncbi:hypothetical protein LINPERPRIM_LOCUS26522 [Linum perenne]